MPEGVARDLVTLFDRPDQVRVPIGDPAEHEERRPNLPLTQGVEIHSVSRSTMEGRESQVAGSFTASISTM